MSRRTYFSKKITDAANEDDDPHREFWRIEVTPKVGLDSDRIEVSSDILTQAENALIAINAVLNKADLSFGDIYYMNVWLRTMRNKKVVSDCIRKHFIADSSIRRSQASLDELHGVTFRLADFEDERVDVMISATEYHGR